MTHQRYPEINDKVNWNLLSSLFEPPFLFKAKKENMESRELQRGACTSIDVPQREWPTLSLALQHCMSTCWVSPTKSRSLYPHIRVIPYSYLVNFLLATTITVVVSHPEAPPLGQTDEKEMGKEEVSNMRVRKDGIIPTLPIQIMVNTLWLLWFQYF